MRCHGQFKISCCSPSAAKSSVGVVKGILLLAFLGLLSGCASGFQATCDPYMEHKRRTIIVFNARSEAKQTWAEFHSDHYPIAAYAADARQGFITGYVDTALGFVNSPPPVPPRRFISIQTFTHSYPNAAAWYDGYNLGTSSALSKGVDRWRLAATDPGLLHPHCAAAIASQTSNLPLEQPSGAMINSEQYPELKQSDELPIDTPSTQDLRSWLQPNSEQIMTPVKSESL